jgi:hypothetical protein
VAESSLRKPKVEEVHHHSAPPATAVATKYLFSFIE